MPDLRAVATAAFFILSTAAARTTICSGGFQHFCALLDEGKVLCWGRNNNGQLGRGDTLDRIGRNSSTAGDGLRAVNLGTGVLAKAIACGGDSTCALTTDGRIKCWGLNDKGQLGLGNNLTIGLAASDMGDNLAYVDLGTGITATQIAMGPFHACALTTSGAVKCWGSNLSGELGHSANYSAWGRKPGQMGDALPVAPLNLQTPSGEPLRVTSIAAGGSYFNRGNINNKGGGPVTCAVLSDGNARCWGNNWYYQLGYSSQAIYSRTSYGLKPGDLESLPNIPILEAGNSVVQMAVGRWHVCALLATGAVKCWGSNNRGQLGFPTTDGLSMGTPWGGALMQQTPAVAFGVSSPPVSIQASGTSTCAVFSDGTAKCWGSNLNGQLGIGISYYYADANNSYIGLNTGDVAKAALIQAGGGTAISSIAATTYTPTYEDILAMGPLQEDPEDTHCLVTGVNYVKCWGVDYNSGLLLRGNDTDRETVYTGGRPQDVGDFMPLAKLFSAYPPMPPSPSPPAPPPVPNPPFPQLAPVANPLNPTLLPRNLTSAVNASLLLMADIGSEAWLSIQSSAAADEGDLGLSPLQITAIVLGGVLGLIIVVGLTSTLVYVLLVKRFASEEGDDVEGGYDEGDWKLMEAAAAEAKLASPHKQPVAEGAQVQPVEAAPSGRPLTLRKRMQPEPPRPIRGPVGEGVQQQPGVQAVVDPEDIDVSGAQGKNGLGGESMLPRGETLVAREPLEAESEAQTPTGCVGKTKTMFGSVLPAWVVSTVNPKLAVFRKAAPILAAGTGVLTLAAVVVVLLVLRQQCNTVCTSVLLYQVDPTDDNIQCAALESTDNLPLYDGTGAGGTMHSSSTLGKCSTLHLQQSLQNYTAAAAAGSSAGVLGSWGPEGIASFNQDPSISGRCAAQLSMGAEDACGEGMTGNLGAICWILTVATVNTALDSTSCLHSLDDDSRRCSRMSYRTIIFQQGPLPGTVWPSMTMCSYNSTYRQGTLAFAFNTSDPSLCNGNRYLPDDGIRCLFVRHTLCQEVDGGGAGLCLRYDTTDLQDLNAEPGVQFGPGTLFQSQVPLGFSRDPTTGTCSPWPLLPFHTSAPLVRGLVISLTQGMMASITQRRRAYMTSSKLSLDELMQLSPKLSTKAEDWVMRHPLHAGGGPLTEFFVSNALYCCSNICPAWLDAAGAALGYAVYLEMLFMFLLVIIYLSMNRKKAEKLKISLHDIVAKIVVDEQKNNDPGDIPEEDLFDRPTSRRMTGAGATSRVSPTRTRQLNRNISKDTEAGGTTTPGPDRQYQGSLGGGSAVRRVTTDSPASMAGAGFAVGTSLPSGAVLDNTGKAQQATVPFVLSPATPDADAV